MGPHRYERTIVALAEYQRVKELGPDQDELPGVYRKHFKVELSAKDYDVRAAFAEDCADSQCMRMTVDEIRAVVAGY